MPLIPRCHFATHYMGLGTTIIQWVPRRTFPIPNTAGQKVNAKAMISLPSTVNRSNIALAEAAPGSNGTTYRSAKRYACGLLAFRTMRAGQTDGEKIMGFRMGIVGLPNVGKSTLFNALTRTAAAQAANFPFCTIEPNVGDVAVPDARLEKLAAIAGSKQIIPTRMTFVDIAGLVRGASKGEGLGNQFLANIRECDAIAHVLRCFEDDDITHVEGKIDPVADAETIETELMLADLESIERRLANLARKIKGGDKDAGDQVRLLKLAQVVLEEGKPARSVEIAEDDKRNWRLLQLLTSKPVLFVCNVEESSAAAGNSLSARVAEMAARQGAGMVVISARIEEEISQLDAEEAEMFLGEMGLEEPGLDRLIRAGYQLLGLQTYFTVGPKEARAWTITKGTLAPAAAGVIHGDFEKGFIRSETVGYDDYIAGNGEAGAKEAGKFRVEGKTYEVKDGDVLHFLFSG
jgi:GTP-binding protein YchF